MADRDINRQWLLARNPKGAIQRDCFEYKENSLPGGTPTEGHVLVQWELFLCAPTIRNWISGNRNSFHPTVEIGSAVLAPGIGRIIESRNADFAPGQRLLGTASWQDRQWIDPMAGYRVIDPGIDSVDAMGVYGLNALTAYCGLKRIGQPRAGDVLLVSGAAGSVGSAVAQIGRIMECQVVGIAGGAEKLRWLREACGIEALIDYRNDDITARMDELMPDGIDIYFDNVGGAILEAAAARMRVGGRIVLCGQISGYDTAGEGEAIAAPPLDMMRLIYGGIRMQGFLARQHADLFPQALADLRRWNEAGLLVHREDVQTGFDQLPETFAALFSGANNGTLLARITDDAGCPI